MQGARRELQGCAGSSTWAVYGCLAWQGLGAISGQGLLVCQSGVGVRSCRSVSGQAPSQSVPARCHDVGLQAPTFDATGAHSAALPAAGLSALAAGWGVRLCLTLTEDDVGSARLRCSSNTRSAARDMRAITSSVLLLSKLAAAAHLPVAGTAEAGGVSRCVTSSDVSEGRCSPRSPSQQMRLGWCQQQGVSRATPGCSPIDQVGGPSCGQQQVCAQRRFVDRGVERSNPCDCEC